MNPSPISRSPDIMGGTPVFAGTRVPVQTLLDYVEAGDTIDEFLAGFPAVSRDQEPAMALFGWTTICFDTTRRSLPYLARSSSIVGRTFSQYGQA